MHKKAKRLKAPAWIWFSISNILVAGEVYTILTACMRKFSEFKDPILTTTAHDSTAVISHRYKLLAQVEYNIYELSWSREYTGAFLSFIRPMNALPVTSCITSGPSKSRSLDIQNQAGINLAKIIWWILKKIMVYVALCLTYLQSSNLRRCVVFGL